MKIQTFDQPEGLTKVQGFLEPFECDELEPLFEQIRPTEKSAYRSFYREVAHVPLPDWLTSAIKTISGDERDTTGETHSSSCKATADGMLNAYGPTYCIGQHVDGGHVVKVAMLSVYGVTAKMRLQKMVRGWSNTDVWDKNNAAGRQQLRVTASPGDLLILEGEAASEWSHGFDPLKGERGTIIFRWLDPSRKERA